MLHSDDSIIGTGEGAAVAAAPQPAPQIEIRSPLNDPNVWLRHPMYEAPADVDIERCQRDIDGIYGVTRDNQSIMKLVWSGDRTYWRELFMQWDPTGQPVGGAIRRPLIRFKVERESATGAFIRDVFPPRWLILTRLEPEQYPNWKDESWIWDATVSVKKLTRPEEPPPVHWLHWAVVKRCNGLCCRIAEREHFMCYGQYAPPQAIYDAIGLQKLADDANGLCKPYEQITHDAIELFENEWTGYKAELRKLQMQREIAVENPAGFLGPVGIIGAGVQSRQEMRDMVEDYFDRKEDELAEKAANQGR